MLDILAVGNALIDAFLSLPPSDACRYNDETKEICMKLGEKLLLTDTQFLLGGNACNVAVGMSRAGFQAGLLAEVGDDEFAEKIIRGLQHENVHIDHIKKQGQSTFSLGISMHGDRVLLTQHQLREHAFSFDAIKTQWIYLTSLGKEWVHAYEKTLQFCKTSGTRLAFNPGALQLQEDISFFKPYFINTEILFLNKQEAQKMLQVHDEDVYVLLETFRTYGCHITVITDAENGAYAIDKDGKKFHRARHDVPVVEKTGAGDGFATGVLAAYVQGLSLEMAMRWGALNAASVIGKVGAEEGLLTKETLEKKAALLPEGEQL